MGKMKIIFNGTNKKARRSMPLDFFFCIGLIKIVFDCAFQCLTLFRQGWDDGAAGIWWDTCPSLCCTWTTPHHPAWKLESACNTQATFLLCLYETRTQLCRLEMQCALSIIIYHEYLWTCMNCCCTLTQTWAHVRMHAQLARFFMISGFQTTNVQTLLITNGNHQWVDRHCMGHALTVMFLLLSESTSCINIWISVDWHRSWSVGSWYRSFHLYVAIDQCLLTSMEHIPS